MLLDEPLRQLLLGRSLNFCSCTTWFLDFGDSAWLYKDLKVLALQAIASVAHQGACWTWNLMAWDLFPLGVTFCYWTFWFSHSKDENATIGISVRMWKTLVLFTKPPDCLLPYRTASRGRSAWRLPHRYFSVLQGTASN